VAFLLMANGLHKPPIKKIKTTYKNRKNLFYNSNLS
jgi:hypothetical protein